MPRLFGNVRRLSGKNKIEAGNGLLFFTYECCLRQVSLVKRGYDVEEVLKLLFDAFDNLL